MRIRHDENVAGGVRVGIQADEAVFSTADDVCRLFGFLPRHSVGDGVVDGGDHITEDAMPVFGLGWRPGAEGSRNSCAGLRVGASDIAVAPGSPEAIHSLSITGLSVTAPLWLMDAV